MSTQMAKIVAVHGIGQQYKADAIIHRLWWPAFRGGLHLAGCDLDNPEEFVCAFYGHLFRRSGSLAISDEWVISDLSSDELSLLQVLWEETSRAEPEDVPSPQEFEIGQPLARVPQMAQRALNALSHSRFWANLSSRLLIGDLKQVAAYFADQQLRERICNTVCAAITSETRMIVGHSLGSVVAYEALCRKPENVVAFLSLGSPLGIRNLIFDRLSPSPLANGLGEWAGRVKQWTNIADKGDVVAVQKRLAPLFGKMVKDVVVYNGSRAHDGERYLATREAGEAACEALWGRSF